MLRWHCSQIGKDTSAPRTCLRGNGRASMPLPRPLALARPSPMTVSSPFPFVRPACAAALAALLAAAPAAFAAAPPLLQPARLIAAAPDDANNAARVLAARRYASFWNSGDPALARAALAPDFVDRTLPPGRIQGLAGALQASRTMRAAVPDLRCEIQQMIVAGDRVVVHLRFRGRFDGRFGTVEGSGQAVDFIATDIYRIAEDRINENWHLEDNLGLMRQLGLVAPAG